jgi:sirohydrochlorin cobaltochelatase
MRFIAGSRRSELPTPWLTINFAAMTTADFSDATLILAGHGSTVNSDSAAPTFQHAETIRSKNIFRMVIESFWKQEPYIWSVLRQTFTPRVFVVPLFISEGYFTEEVLPREFGFSKPDGSFSRLKTIGAQTFYYCKPVGTHPLMTGALLSRATAILTQFPLSPAPVGPGECSLFIAGHGTGNNENSRTIIEQQVRLIRDRNVFRDVHSLYMEEEPRIEKAYELAATSNLVIVPFFISDGLHSFEDIPVMLGESVEVVQKRLHAGVPTWQNPTQIRGKNVWYTSSIGNEPFIPEIILERVQEAVFFVS